MKFLLALVLVAYASAMPSPDPGPHFYNAGKPVVVEIPARNVTLAYPRDPFVSSSNEKPIVVEIPARNVTIPDPLGFNFPPYYGFPGVFPESFPAIYPFVARPDDSMEGKKSDNTDAEELENLADEMEGKPPTI